MIRLQVMDLTSVLELATLTFVSVISVYRITNNSLINFKLAGHIQYNLSRNTPRGEKPSLEAHALQLKFHITLSTNLIM